MIWRGFRVFLVVIFVALLCRACLVKDVPTSKDTIKTSTNEELSISYPTPKNVTINGVDYEGYAQGSTNPTPNTGKVPTAGASFKITAKTDGKNKLGKGGLANERKKSQKRRNNV